MHLWATVWDYYCTLQVHDSCQACQLLVMAVAAPWPHLWGGRKTCPMSRLMRLLLLLQLGAILVVGVLDGKHGFNFPLLVRMLSSLLLAWPIVMALAAGVVAT